MTHQQAVRTALAFFAEAYPSSTPPENPRLRVDVWADSLAAVEPDRIVAAAQTWVAVGNRYMPNLGEMHAMVRDAAYGAIPSQAEAWVACTSSAPTDELHPILRRVVQITGGRASVAWMREYDARNYVRGAYFQALQQFKLDADPTELPQHAINERRGGSPMPIGTQS